MVQFYKPIYIAKINGETLLRGVGDELHQGKHGL